VLAKVTLLGVEARLTIVFAAPAVSWIEDQTGWPIKRSARTARRDRTIQIRSSTHTLAAGRPLPDALDRIHRDSGAH
jgi:hypothetical protein